MPHEWLIGFGGIALVILGSSYLVYVFLLRRDETVRVYKRQGTTDASPDPRGSPLTASEQQGMDTDYPEDVGAEESK